MFSVAKCYCIDERCVVYSSNFIEVQVTRKIGNKEKENGKQWTVMLGRRVLDSILMMVIESKSTCIININTFNTLQNKL
jgi:hypothetical protein